MEPEVSVEGGSMIRVAVVAIGEMPPSQFRDYVEMLVQHAQIPLSTVSTYYTEHQKSPFSQQLWETGSLLLKFMVGGASKSPWEDFQAHRKILGVIGLCHLPLTPDISTAYDQFLTICKAYPSAQVTRCFAFHPTDVQIDSDDEKKKEFLVMFPTMDRQKLKSHMQILMQDFAASLLMAFESWVLHLKPVRLVTPLDSQVSLTSDEVNKKRKLGRVQKTMGDYCLLAGSPLDANSHYYTAIELARLTGDSLWQAGAIEGYVCALVLDRAGHKDYLLEQEVQFRYSEVIQLYRRATALSFELEATLKLARFLCRKELAKEVMELVMGAVEWSKGLMDASDRLVVNVEAARIFAAIGYDRKAAFYARQVGLLYQQQHSHWAAVSALQVMSLTAESYKCLSNKAEGKERQVGEWSTLQVDVLYDMLSAAVRAGDALAAWNAAARLLRNHFPLIPPSSQSTLATALSMSAKRLDPGTRSVDPGIPFVRLHSYTAMPADREIVKRSASNKEWWKGRTSTGPFIYTPFTAKGDANTRISVTWVVGEPVEVLVELANPCVFEVTVESIALSVEHTQFEAFPVSVTLPPSSGQVVSLSGLPLSVGSLTVRGCIVKCFGVITEHLFEEVCEWGSVKGTALLDVFRSGHKVHQPAQYEKVEVVPPLPMLVARVVSGEGAAVLYEGEIREMQISLSNAGVVPVVEAHMTLTGKQQQHVMCIGHSVLEDALPLPPGATVVVPVTLKAGAPTADIDLRNLVRLTKDTASPMLVIHYAGPLLQEGADPPPGRRVALPLQLHVLKGLCLVQAKFLSMEVAANISSSLPDSVARDQPSESEESLVKMDPYRGSWGMRLLELELWNATDVLFEIVVTSKEAGEGGSMVEDAECLYPRTRIDRDYAARVLIPLERFKLAGLDKASLARVSIRRESMIQSKDGIERQAKVELNAAIDELSSKICVRWTSGRNSAGELPIKDALREALQASVLKILLPDSLTFGFRLAKTSISAPSLRSVRDSGDLDSLPGSPRIGLQKVEADDGGLSTDNKGGFGVRELAPIEMLVRNNTNEAVKMTLSVTCRDVTGTSCLGAAGTKATVLWAGTLDRVNVEVGALGEVVHRFSLCFLVPGQYTLLGSAVINSQPGHEALSYTGPPFAVDVVETS
ncbi:trafficking protein particle complex II-specific subunit 120 homolog [Physcomitrium patens]|uniref:Uncharacterized protein n=1 Tax=Physcomitrium patens TaxID=3218 RepID=A0A2K1IP90_PHYPA|nr:trafficking protein particle complex II-specific subunit 120 homolog [Physcomitrium patens]PNR31094.1 hypothetical protein PHYPA_027410 [Physcomitrium patens]|eukprot:XP_024360781.1 trafficking protein particle complex II-specific subunit 120 homolog [Physcomitrella patens]